MATALSSQVPPMRQRKANRKNSGGKIGGTMRRERALKIVLVVVGLLFTAGVVPLTMFFSRESAVPMIMSIYVTLGVFLLLAVRDPAANRSLIAFGGWANLAHAGIMAAQEYRNVIERRELAGAVVFAPSSA